MYDVRFLPQAEKYVRILKDKALQEAYAQALRAIAKEPYSGQENKGDLSGIFGWNVFYAGTNYEIAYRVYEEKEQLVIVVLAGTRENFYKQLKRYIKF